MEAVIKINDTYCCNFCYHLFAKTKIVTCTWSEKRILVVPEDTPTIDSGEFDEWLNQNKKLESLFTIERESYDFTITEIQ
jgi:hypothetical protein